MAQRFGIERVYDDPREMLAKESLDFVDCITDVDTHSQFVHLAAEHKLPVICQKPLGPSLEVAREMDAACRGRACRCWCMRTGAGKRRCAN